MLDLEDIKRAHEDDLISIDDPYLPRGKAILKFQRTHHHRDLLLAEVERLRRERDEALARWERAINFYPHLEDL